MAKTTYMCSVCQQTFNDVNSLSEHMITNHTTKTEIIEEGEEK